jgi:MGT family glycosyltransferase
MHYLFALWDGGGTVPPELSVVRRLVARGHTVTALADARLEAQVRATGADFQAWRTAPHRRSERPEDDLFRDWEVRSPPQAVQRLCDGIMATPAARFAHDVREALAERPADAVVANFMLLGAQLAAEAAGRPLAVLVPNIYPVPAEGMPPFGTGWAPARGPLGRLRERAVGALSRRLWRRGLPALNAARAEHGLPPLRELFEQLGRAQRVFVLSSRAFDFPAALPAHVRYTGPVLEDPAWVAPWTPRPGPEPLVLVALSSTFQDQRAVLQRVVDGLGQLPVRGLVTTGPCIDPAQLRAAPRVEVVRSAPHAQVLPHASAVVTHGGHGTVMKALAAGLPLVCLPMGRDQTDNAARIVARGVGLRLAAAAPPHAVAAAVRRVLAQPGYREAAQRLGATLRAEAEASPLIGELEALAASAGLSRAGGSAPRLVQRAAFR